jgi:hypothetical protein
VRVDELEFGHRRSQGHNLRHVIFGGAVVRP